MRISDWSSDVCSSDLLQEEIFVAPALVRGVAVVAERRAQVARGAVPVQYVFVDRIERREVEAAAEPPGQRLPVAYGAEVAHVGVRGRPVRIARVDDQGNAHRPPGRAGQPRPPGGNGARACRDRGCRTVYN